MEPGQLTRVLSDFFTTNEGELSLSKGEYFLLIGVVDKHWWYGESWTKRGKFPSNHLHTVDIPNINDTENLFVTIAPFKGEQEGDLIFDQGELVIGEQEVEAGWWSGYIDNTRTGVFPLSHVWLLDKKILKKPGNKKVVRKKAKVKTSLKAELEEELDLTQGDIVTVIEILDDGWVRGITSDNKTGTFPEAFIKYIEESMDYPDEGAAISPVSVPQLSINQTPTYKDFGQSSSSSQHYTEEPAPSYFDLFPEAKASNVLPAHETDTDNLNPLGLQPYAITLYPFKAQYPNELNFEAGEVVHLTRHIDSDWAEGNIENEKGMFPTSYVNIIVDCSEENRIDSNIRNEHEELTKNYYNFEAGQFVKIAYTFDAQMKEDLTVKEGEIVTILETINEGWVSVKNKNGEIGLCPRGYLSEDKVENDDDDNEPVEENDFVVIRSHEKNEDQRVKRISEPHRPAPPTPAPGSVPLQKQSITEKSQLHSQELNEANDEDINENEAIAQKKFEKRQNVISELIITEKEYVRDLKVTYETFNLYEPKKLETRGIDVLVLFGNILEVIHVAEELLDLMLRSMKGVDESHQMIAPCFLKMTEKLQTAYGKYCGNHEAALSLLKKYEENRDIMIVFEKGIETLRHQVVCFDMSSVLIKPVQRILKYPLMLYELVKCTEENHPDRAGIEEAWKAMTAVASYINEYKRRKDIVSKYLDTDNTLMSKMSKLSMHSVAKKSSRLSAKLSASFGLTNMPADPIFEELEKQFKMLEKCTWQLHYDVEQCMSYLNDETVCGEMLSDFLNQYHHGNTENEVRKFYQSRVMISSQFMKTLKDTVEKRVNQPIAILITLLEGPSVLITKRYDKLLDYDNAISKGDRNRDSRLFQDELTDAKNNYIALNEQLLEELPIFIEAATEILATCIEAFTSSRKLFYGKIMDRYLRLSESATQVSSQDILQSFLINHNLLWNQISRLSFESGKLNPEIKKPELSAQCDKDRIILMKKYPGGSFYIAKSNIDSASTLDLSIVKGTVVVAIKKQDPMGDSLRWYVDSGSAQGFIPSNILKPIPQPRQLPQQYSNDVVDSRTNNVNLMSLDSPVKEERNDLINLESPVKQPNKNTNVSQLYGNIDSLIDDEQSSNQQQQRYANVEAEFYVADYTFDGFIPGTLAIKKGQTLMLVKQHDKKGNNDWWLMENRYGLSGYVPKNYVSRHNPST